ncbi:amino acid/amide ABC transporter substrate-binding protein (HAAT family) [Rhodovulum imhoffii]|uniref:Amino acid/amide ABC transporter substrate-binding protein (HAAT family) n=1 Tax=Rhodovulum imhoffii TaxID=365340 RepID=A0A2T5BV36_9RHOB|nr:ABC transporter substrate-binding protein [Rhodovulum imhoffii]MBK5934650.1 ABC transporter permease [Rhodovulum imhoffii]PTN03376.1 amino acid/amide ABC transporter substrate-binding protein (HAAT family) [Rhodovulum imhoffii]
MTKTTLMTLALGAALAAGPALADLVFPDLSYRTGPYAAGGIPFSDGYQDYFTLMNERDGGIGGAKARVIECETAYNTEKGVECYEATKGEGALIYQPLSTGITYQLIPKISADGIPLHTMGYGRTSAANGKVFEWVFNYPANYWNAASVAINYLLEENGGNLSGKKITLLYHNSAYGKEPIRTLEELASKHGYTFNSIPVDHPGQEQKSQWLQIRRERPDYVIMWGWGVMNQVAIQEAANIRFPMENFIGAWWSGAEHDVSPAGQAAHGYKALNMNRIGDLPVFDDIRQYVVEPGLAAGDGSNVGSVLYTRGMYAAMLAVEAARTAQGIHGTPDITAAMMRDGMEALEMTNARMEALGAPGIGPEFSVSCENHGGSGMGIVQQWDANNGEWVALTDYIPSDNEVIDPLIVQDSMAFAGENNITPRCE